MSRGDWLHEQLFERRIVLVSGRLDDTAAAKAAAALLALDAGGGPAPPSPRGKRPTRASSTRPRATGSGARTLAQGRRTPAASQFRQTPRSCILAASDVV